MKAHLKWLPLTSAFVFFGILLLWSNQTEIRFSQDTCQYQALFKKTPPRRVDYLFLGGSRIREAISAPLFATFIKNRNQTLPVVYDLSRVWWHPEFTYLVAKEAWKQLKVSELLVEFRGNFSVQDHHPATPVLATTSDLWQISIKDVQYPWFRRLGYFLFAINERISTLSESLIRKTNLEEVPLSGLQKDCTKEETFSRLVNNTELLQNPAETILPWDLGSKKFEAASFFTDRLIELAKKNHTKLTFIYIPTYLSPLPSRAQRRQVEERFGVRFLVPPDPLVQTLYQPQYYADRFHLTPKGRELYLKWLSAEVVS